MGGMALGQKKDRGWWILALLAIAIVVLALTMTPPPSMRSQTAATFTLSDPYCTFFQPLSGTTTIDSGVYCSYLQQFNVGAYDLWAVLLASFDLSGGAGEDAGAAAADADAGDDGGGEGEGDGVSADSGDDGDAGDGDI